MSSLLGKLKSVGKLHSQGEFTLDVEAAGAKMARFQFRDDSEFLSQLVAGLFHLGAEEIKVKTQSDGLSLELVPPLTVSPEVPGDLFRHMLDEESRLRRLAAATQAILSHHPTRFLWQGPRNQSYDLTEGTASDWQKPQLKEISLAGLAPKLVSQARAHLLKHGRYSRRPLSLDGTALQELQTWPARLGPHTGHCQLQAELTSSRLILVVDEIATDAKVLELDLPWEGVFHWSGPARLDASLASIVEDENYAELVRDIPSTFESCLSVALADASRLHNQRFRHFCFDLVLRQGDAAWLQAAKRAIVGLELFEDQQGGRWSLTRLERENQPLYHSRSLPSVAVEALVLVEPDSVATNLLFQYFGERLTSLTELVLKQLIREANLRNWNKRSPQLFELPSDAWLAQRTFQFDDNKVILGIAADWSLPGGSMTILHQGKFLASLELKHDEIACGAVAEVEAKEIGELWNELIPERARRLQAEVAHQLDSMLKDLVAEEAGAKLGAVRQHLLRHLARSKRPEESHFARTLLFQDLQGNLHSLHTLLNLRSQGSTIAWVRPDHPDLDTFPSSLLPDNAVWIVGDEEVWRCLSQVISLNAKDFNALLNDLWDLEHEIRPPRPTSPLCREFTGPDGSGKLYPLPALGSGQVVPCIQGHWLDPVPVNSELAFEAVVDSPKLKFNIRTDPHRMGARRWSLISNQQTWKKLQAQLQQELKLAIRSLAEQPPEQLLKEWHPLVESLLLLGWGQEYPGFQNLVCLPTLPQRSSIKDLCAAPCVYWSSGSMNSVQLAELREKHGSPLVWSGLTQAQQQTLARAHPEIRWECLDDWLASQARMAEFLKKPMLDLRVRHALISRMAQPPLQGQLAFSDPAATQGQIQWLYLQRPMQRDTHELPPGVVAYVESSELQPDEEFQQLGPPEKLAEVRAEVLRQMHQLLLDWLSEPQARHTEFSRHWFDWVETCPPALEKLREQPWISTSQGYLSWNQIMASEAVYRLESPAQQELPPGTLFLFERSNPNRLLDSLCSLHPKALGRKESERWLHDWHTQRRRELQLRKQQQRFKNLQRKIGLQEPVLGEVALIPKPYQDCWLVTDEQLLRVSNLPCGLAGYVQTESYTVKRLGKEQRAELHNSIRKAILEQLLPVVLKRLDDGRLKAAELPLIAEYQLAVLHTHNPESIQAPWRALVEAHWIPLADGSRTSLAQLRLEAQERKGLEFWPRYYRLAGSCEDLVPILATPELVQLVTRWCGYRPVERPKPILYRDVSELAQQPLSSFRQVLQGIGKWVGGRAGAGFRHGLRLLERGGGALRQGVERLTDWQAGAAEPEAEARPSRQRKARKAEQSGKKRSRVETSPAPEDQLELLGRPLLTALRRNARAQLNGQARKETMAVLERARWAELPSNQLWSFSDQASTPLLLNSQHPLLARWLGEQEPPPPVVLSLLLGLVSAINARSQPFTDVMEFEFLDGLLRSVVSSYRDQIPK